jgi:hypothetical protein
MIYVLLAAVAAGAVVGGAQSFATSKSPSADAPAEPAPIAAETPSPHAQESADDEASTTIEGKVLEVIDVPNYTYVRLESGSDDGTWAAVPTASLKVGERARVANAMKMSGFKSSALKRTFPEIYFGTLAGSKTAMHGSLPEGAAGSPHGGDDPHAGFAADHAASADPHRDPHAQNAQGAQVQPVERAPGANGKTVAEIIGQRTALSGKTIRVRATVVKATPGVLGRTYLHVRDGSGDPAAGTNDLVATTEATPSVGQTIVLEGVVAIDRDVGAGYRFPTIVEDCKVITP